jgi:hypothetical protein
MDVSGIPYLWGLGLLLAAAEVRSDAMKKTKLLNFSSGECQTPEFLFGERQCHGDKRGQKKEKRSRGHDGCLF